MYEMFVLQIIEGGHVKIAYVIENVCEEVEKRWVEMISHRVVNIFYFIFS